MKSTMTCLVAAGLAVFSFNAATASESIPLRVTLCYAAPGFEDWHYERSYDVTDGIEDHHPHLTIRFAPSENGREMAISTSKIRQLSWDPSFDRVESPVGVLCAQQRWFGQQKFEDHCRLSGQVVRSPYPSIECDWQATYVFQGEITIR